ncbi:hypothetical protein TNCV_4983361, partial [Trichonephila clavipes]
YHRSLFIHLLFTPLLQSIRASNGKRFIHLSACLLAQYQIVKTLPDQFPLRSNTFPLQISYQGPIGMGSFPHRPYHFIRPNEDLGMIRVHVQRGLCKSRQNQIEHGFPCQNPSRRNVTRDQTMALVTMIQRVIQKSIFYAYKRICKVLGLASIDLQFSSNGNIGRGSFEWYRYRTVASLCHGFEPNTTKRPRRVGQRCTLNLSRAETSLPLV